MTLTSLKGFPYGLSVCAWILTRPARLGGHVDLAASEVDFQLIRIASLLKSNPARPPAKPHRSCAATRSCGCAAAARTAHRACGDARAAAAELRSSPPPEPDSAPGSSNSDETLAASGDAGKRSARCSKAVQLQPDLAEAWGELAALHRYSRRSEGLRCGVTPTRATGAPGRPRRAAAALAARRWATAEARLAERLARARGCGRAAPAGRGGGRA